MNRQEMIEAWKKNTTVFGEMSKEMREFAEEIPSNNFFFRTDNDGWRRNCDVHDVVLEGNGYAYIRR